MRYFALQCNLSNTQVFDIISNCNFPSSFQGFWLKSKTVLNEESMDQRNSLVCLCLPSKNTLRSRVGSQLGLCCIFLTSFI